MKRLNLFLLVMSFSLLAFSQKTIENPYVKCATEPNLTINRVELTDSFTIVNFTYTGTFRYRFSIPRETYIEEVGLDKKLYVIKGEDIELGNRQTIPKEGERNYSLYFPKLSDTAKAFDFGEGNDGGDWFIYGVNLDGYEYTSILPEVLYGNWMKTDGSNKWDYGLLLNHAIVDAKIWDYESVDRKGKSYLIKLRNGDEIKELKTKIVKKTGELLISENDITSTYKKSFTANPNYTTESDKAFQTLAFKRDTAILRGYIEGFCTDMKKSTGMVYVNDAILGDQQSYTLKIESDGSFMVKVPLNQPQTVYVRMPFVGSNEIYLEPGKSVFQFISSKNLKPKVLFMGDLAQVNRDLLAVKNIKAFDYNKAKSKVLDLDPIGYKLFLLEERAEAEKELVEYASKNFMSAKALQIKNIEFEYGTYQNIMSYHYTWASAYRDKHKIPRTQRNLGVEVPKGDKEFYDFVTPELMENELAMIYSGYYFFINRLKYASIVREYDGHSRSSLADMMAYMEDQGAVLTDEEKELLEKTLEWEKTEAYKEAKQMVDKYNTEAISYRRNNYKQIKAIKENNTDLTDMEIAQQLADSAVSITDKQWEYLRAQDAFNKSDYGKASKEFNESVNEARKTFYSKFNKEYKSFFVVKNMGEEKAAFKELFGIEGGIGLELMMAQSVLSTLKREFKPLSSEQLAMRQKEFSIPYIAEYLAIVNNDLIAEIEANKAKTGYNINDTPKTDADKVFQEIMAKYFGKSILVDFWATWCGPCRSGMERIKPLKEELKDENVVFVYITNESSPEEACKNYIPDVKGEHYRVSSDEWNNLCGKFNIGGIPHYLLVDKDGVVVNNNKLPERNLEAMKKLLLENAN